MSWSTTVTFLLIGYLCMSRSFAYWGIPQLHIFVGEIVLGSFLVGGPINKNKRWLWIAMKQPKLIRFTRVFFAFLAFGVFEAIRGLIMGHPALDALRDLAFNYYPLYLFLGIWIGLRDKEYLPRLIRMVAWINGFYGLIFIFILSHISLFSPGVAEQVGQVPLFGEPMFSATILLGLISFEANLQRIWLPLTLNAAVLIGMLIRAEWLELVVGLLVWAWATRNFKRVAMGAAVVLVLFSLMYISNFTYAGPELRGGTISATEIVARVLAPISSDTAGEYSSDSENLNMYAGNVTWRTIWWASIWSTVNENSVRSAFGLGYGFPLGDLVPYLEDSSTRTPHNIFFFTLGYTGWVGVALFAAFQMEIARMLWASWRRTNQAFGIAFWVAILAFACFTPFFETPQGAIPFYLIVGCSCAAMFAKPKPAGLTTSEVNPRKNHSSTRPLLSRLPMKPSSQGVPS